jgi:hypothetical protein
MGNQTEKVEIAITISWFTSRKFIGHLRRVFLFSKNRERSVELVQYVLRVCKHAEPVLTTVSLPDSDLSKTYLSYKHITASYALDLEK